MPAAQHSAALDSRRELANAPIYRENRALDAPLKWSRWNRISLFGCIVVMAAALWMVASMGAGIDSLNYQIASSQAKVSELAAINASLTADTDALQKPTRILSVALNKLHMQYQNPLQIGVSKETSGR